MKKVWWAGFRLCCCGGPFPGEPLPEGPGPLEVPGFGVIGHSSSPFQCPRAPHALQCVFFTAAGSRRGPPLNFRPRRSPESAPCARPPRSRTPCGGPVLCHGRGKPFARRVSGRCAVASFAALVPGGQEGLANQSPVLVHHGRGRLELRVLHDHALGHVAEVEAAPGADQYQPQAGTLEQAISPGLGIIHAGDTDSQSFQ